MMCPSWEVSQPPLRSNTSNSVYYSYVPFANLAVARGSIPFVASNSLNGTTQNPSSEYHLLHPHHDVLHSYSHSYAKMLNTPMIPGLYVHMYNFLSDFDGDTQFMHRTLRKHCRHLRHKIYIFYLPSPLPWTFAW